MLSILALAGIAGLLLWLLSGRGSSEATTPVVSTHMDYEAIEAAEELRAAEDDVRDLDSGAQPGEDQPGDDWGPGAASR